MIIPDERGLDIKLFDICKGLETFKDRELERFINKYGKGSEQLRFVQTKMDEMPGN